MHAQKSSVSYINEELYRKCFGDQMRPEEIKKVVCNIVKFKRENQPWDLDTMVICIGLIEEYKVRTEKILRELRIHRQKIPTQISGGIKIHVITRQIAEEGGRIHTQMQELTEEFIAKECRDEV